MSRVLELYRTNLRGGVSQHAVAMLSLRGWRWPRRIPHFISQLVLPTGD